jgi:putative transcriptional regulator
MNARRRRLLAAALGAPLLRIFDARAAETALANGVFLIAKPELSDDNFRETVVLITQPQPGSGPLGVIINRPLAARLSEALPDIGTIPDESQQIYSGGPVAQNRVLFLVRSTDAPANSLRVLDDIYLTGDAQLPAKTARGELKAAAFRAYVGYAGWGPRQLQGEIAAGGWHIMPADADIIFAAEAFKVWPEMIKRATQRVTQAAPVVAPCS